MTILLSLFGAILLAAPAAAQERTASVSLRPGDAAVVRIDNGEVSADVQRGGAQWTPLDVAAARHLSGQAPIDAPATEPTVLPADRMPEPPPVARGEIRLRVHDIAGRHTMLVIENGYDRALVFHAEMARDNRRRPTDVCLVVPNNRSFEHWPDQLDSLELSQLVLIDWREGDPVPCR